MLLVHGLETHEYYYDPYQLQGKGVVIICNKILLKEIESYRNKMVTLASNSSLDNREVIRISKELDTLIHQYQMNKAAKK